MAAFATAEDLATHLQRDLDAADTATAEQLLDLASALIRTAAETDFDGETDQTRLDVLRMITLSMSQRSIVNPEGIRSESIDNYSTTLSFNAADVYLTSEEKNLVRKLAGRSGLWAQPTTRGDKDVPSVWPNASEESAPLEETDPFDEGLPS